MLFQRSLLGLTRGHTDCSSSAHQPKDPSGLSTNSSTPSVLENSRRRLLCCNCLTRLLSSSSTVSRSPTSLKPPLIFLSLVTICSQISRQKLWWSFLKIFSLHLRWINLLEERNHEVILSLDEIHELDTLSEYFLEMKLWLHQQLHSHMRVNQLQKVKHLHIGFH